MPFNSSPITVKDASAVDKALIAFNDGVNSAFAHPLLDSEGALVDPATNVEIAKIYQPKVGVSANFTRPANTIAYAANDLVANSTIAGSVVAMSFAAARGNDITGHVTRAVLHKSSNVTTNGTFRLHLFSSAQTVANGDNGVFTPAALTSYLGCLEGSIMQAASTGSVAVLTPVYGSAIAFAPETGTQNIFGLIEVRAPYVPANAEVFTVNLEVV